MSPKLIKVALQILIDLPIGKEQDQGGGRRSRLTLFLLCGCAEGRVGLAVVSKKVLRVLMLTLATDDQPRGHRPCR